MRGGSKRDGQPIVSHQSHAILHHESHHAAKESDGGYELSKGSCHPTFTPLFNDYDIHSASPQSSNGMDQGTALMNKPTEYAKYDMNQMPLQIQQIKQAAGQGQREFTNMDIFETMEKEMK